MKVRPIQSEHRHELAENDGILRKASGMKFNPRVFCALSYATVLVIGLCIFADFGVSWDERYNLELGEVVFDHVFKGAPWITSGQLWFYGPFFDLSAHMLLKAFRVEDMRSIFLGKHLITFLYFWVSLFFFFKLCRGYFGKWIPAYIACVLLVIHPRILAESFYNPKDLPFMSMFLIACFTLQWYLERKTILRGIVHGLVCAICIDIRILGVFVPLFTAFMVLLENLAPGTDEKAPSGAIASFSAYTLSVISFTVLLWPQLWNDPVGGFLNILQLLSAFPYPWSVLYQGELFGASTLPWHYLPVWILISTPVSIPALFLIGNLGLVVILKGLLGRTKDLSARALLPYLWFWAPLATVIGLHSSVYNGWRHMYFIYPAMVMIAVQGATILWELIVSLRRPWLRKVITGAFLVTVSLDLASVLVFTVRSHPNQYVYFNPVVGGLPGTEGRYEWDYFGLAHRQLLEKLLKNHAGEEPIAIVGTEPTYNNIGILKPEERRRLRFVALVPISKRYLDPARLGQTVPVYYCSNLRGGVLGEFARYPAVSSVKVGDRTIAVAVRVDPTVPRGPKTP